MTHPLVTHMKVREFTEVEEQPHSQMDIMHREELSQEQQISPENLETAVITVFSRMPLFKGEIGVKYLLSLNNGKHEYFLAQRDISKELGVLRDGEYDISIFRGISLIQPLDSDEYKEIGDHIISNVYPILY